MVKTTVYLPDELDTRLGARAGATRTSKAELVRRAVARLLDEGEPDDGGELELPVFHGGRSWTVEEMDRALADQIAERAARR